MEGWHTSIGANGKAHYYIEGKPSCGGRKAWWPGTMLGDLFTRPTRPAVVDDHLCHYCAKNYPGLVCACWSCSMRREGKLR